MTLKDLTHTPGVSKIFLRQEEYETAKAILANSMEDAQFVMVYSQTPPFPNTNHVALSYNGVLIYGEGDLNRHVVNETIPQPSVSGFEKALEDIEQ